MQTTPGCKELLNFGAATDALRREEYFLLRETFTRSRGLWSWIFSVIFKFQTFYTVKKRLTYSSFFFRNACSLQRPPFFSFFFLQDKLRRFERHLRQYLLAFLKALHTICSYLNLLSNVHTFCSLVIFFKKTLSNLFIYLTYLLQYFPLRDAANTSLS